VEKERVGDTHTRLTVETEGDFSESEGRTARAGANASAERCARMRVFVCVHGCRRESSSGQGACVSGSTGVLRARCATRCETLPQTKTLHCITSNHLAYNKGRCVSRCSLKATHVS